MALAVVGPGRVGQALGRRLHESGVELLGFLGRDPKQAEAAVEFAGGGRVFATATDLATDLAAADMVMIAVQDDVLAETAASLAPPLAAAGFRGLCFHVSGAHDLSPLDPLAGAGAVVGSLHPLCPVPDAATGYAALPGQPAVVEASGGGEALRRLQDLAKRAGLVPVAVAAADRLLYHTACVLAANGLTAFCGLLEDLFATALDSDQDQDPGRAKEIARLPAALMAKALETCRDHGATAALSGPVPRGDEVLIGRQLRRLKESDHELAELYRLLISKAVTMAESGGLDPAAAARLRAVLGGPSG